MLYSEFYSIADSDISELGTKDDFFDDCATAKGIDVKKCARDIGAGHHALGGNAACLPRGRKGRAGMDCCHANTFGFEFFPQDLA